MSTITLEKDSHLDHGKYRVDFEITKKILGDNQLPTKLSLPVKHSKLRVAIIGGGFGGIVLAMTMKNKLHEDDYLLIEKYPKLGGTWIANTYPGVACDIPSIWYQISSDLSANWSKSQSYGYEIAEYLDRVVEKYHIKDNALLGNAVHRSVWHEDAGEWELEIHDVTTGQKTLHRLKVLINCLGGLVHPLHPLYPGLKDKFQGEYVHSAMWRDVELKGKKVVVLGNGCSACQLVPALVNDGYGVESVTQIARSKQYIIPPLPSSLQRTYNLVSKVWILQYLLRLLVVALFELRYAQFKGTGWWSRAVRWWSTKISVSYMKKHTPKKYWDVVIPDYKIGCKRLIIDHLYLDTLSNPKMEFIGELVDHFEEKGLVLKLGRFIECDVLVACTGYNIAKSMNLCEFVGRDGVKLSELWGGENGRISAYESLMVKDMPNLFTIGGPNLATGHSLVVMAIENGCLFVTKVVSPVLKGEAKLVVVKDKAYYKWYEDCQQELKKSVYGTKFGGCVLWYAGEYNYTTYPYSQVTFWWRTNHPVKGDLEYTK